MKKILIVQNWVRHYRKPLYNALSQLYDVTVIHSGDVSAGEGDLYSEIRTPLKRLGPFFWQPKILTTLRSDEFDAVVVMFDIRWIANVAAVFSRRPYRFLYWGHRYSKNRVANKVRDFLLRRSDGVILYSDFEIERLIANGLPESKIFVAPNTIHIANHADGSAEKKDSVLFTGRAQKRKKVDELIRAFAEVLAQLPDGITLDIVGAGAENDTLKALATELGVLDRVIFHGEIVDEDRLRPLFHRALAYVSPGPVGLAVLHSFAYGVPVVTNRAGKHGPEFGELVDGRNSRLYTTYEELKAILVDLWADRAYAAMLGKNAYKQYSERRSLPRMVEGFVAALENEGGS